MNKILIFLLIFMISRAPTYIYLIDEERNFEGIIRTNFLSALSLYIRYPKSKWLQFWQVVEKPIDKENGGDA